MSLCAFYYNMLYERSVNYGIEYQSRPSYFLGGIRHVFGILGGDRFCGGEENNEEADKQGVEEMDRSGNSNGDSCGIDSYYSFVCVN